MPYFLLGQILTLLLLFITPENNNIKDNVFRTSVHKVNMILMGNNNWFQAEKFSNVSNTHTHIIHTHTKKKCSIYIIHNIL